MPWHPALTQLRDILAELYPEADDARRVAASALLPVEHIDLQGEAANIWQSVLEEAEKQGRTEAIIQAATSAREYPNNPALKEAASAYLQQSAPSPARGQPAGAPAVGQRRGCTLSWRSPRATLALNLVVTFALFSCGIFSFAFFNRPGAPGQGSSDNLGFTILVVALALIGVIWIAWGVGRWRRRGR